MKLVKTSEFTMGEKVSLNVQVKQGKALFTNIDLSDFNISSLFDKKIGSKSIDKTIEKDIIIYYYKTKTVEVKQVFDRIYVDHYNNNYSIVRRSSKTDVFIIEDYEPKRYELSDIKSEFSELGFIVTQSIQIDSTRKTSVTYGYNFETETIHGQKSIFDNNMLVSNTSEVVTNRKFEPLKLELDRLIAQHKETLRLKEERNIRPTKELLTSDELMQEICDIIEAIEDVADYMKITPDYSDAWLIYRKKKDNLVVELNQFERRLDNLTMLELSQSKANQIEKEEKVNTDDFKNFASLEIAQILGEPELLKTKMRGYSENEQNRVIEECKKSSSELWLTDAYQDNKEEETDLHDFIIWISDVLENNCYYPENEFQY